MAHGAFFWGALAASSLLLGAAIALLVTVPARVLGLVMGFGAGVLISAVAYELVQEAFDVSGGQGAVSAGLMLGAVAYFVGDGRIERLGTGAGTTPDLDVSASEALGIVLGTILDGVPESLVLGLTVLDGTGVSVAVLAAVFLSNLPEAIAATAGLRERGWQVAHVLGLWAGIVLVSGLAALVGALVFEDASGTTVALVDAFAAGAILTMLADTMIPGAFAEGGRYVGLATTAGFALAFAISALE